LLDIVREFDVKQNGSLPSAMASRYSPPPASRKANALPAMNTSASTREQAGGTFVDQQAVRDGRIVTGQTWQSHPEFYREIFACLAS